jgi:hypothetical protein
MSEKVATINRVIERKDIAMSITRVVFMGSDVNQVYENFTFKSTYLAKPSKNGFLTVLDDTGTWVEMPVANFELKLSEYVKELAYVS